MSSTTSQAPRRRRAGATLALLAFAQLIISLDYNIVYVALPGIGSGLGFSAQDLQWVVSAYAVAFGGFLLLGGRASGDRQSRGHARLTGTDPAWCHPSSGGTTL